MVSIPFKRESVSQAIKCLCRNPKTLEFQFPSNGKAYHKFPNSRGKERLCKRFQFPSNGKAYHKKDYAPKPIKEIQFQFPSNGKAYHKRPHFKPSGAVGPKAQKQTRSARGFFWGEILAPKSHKPACTLKQTRFFYKNDSEAKRSLGSWAFFAVPVHNRRIAYGVVIKYTRHLKKCQIFSNAPW